MPHKSKGIYTKYSKLQLDMAVSMVRSGKLTLRAASKHYKVPRSTISDRITGKISPGSVPGRAPAVPVHIERLVTEKLVTISDRGFGISRQNLLLKIGSICGQLKIKTPFKDGIPGSDWFLGFKRRNPEISIRKPQKLSTSRTKCMNRKLVGDYFSTLESEMAKVEQNPMLIWNMDESGFHLEHTPQRVVGRKGANIPGRVSCNRENVTITACVSAAGQIMPPMIIVKGKTYKSLLSFSTDEGPVGAVWTWQQKAWTDDSLGIQWFKEVFLKNCGKTRPQLLIMDQHRSHEVLDFIELAVKENIILLALPSHTSHWLQPLDKGCFGPLTQRYNQVCTDFMAQSPSCVVCKPTWAKLFKKAWDMAMTPTNARKGFQFTGIFPLNQYAIPSRAFEPASVYNISSGHVPAAAGSPSATPQDVTAGSPSATPQDVTAGSPSATPQDVTAGSPSATPQDVTAGFPPATPQDVTARFPLVTFQDVTAGSLSATPQDVTVGSPSATPQDVTAGSPSATPQDVTAGSPSATPQDVTAGSPSATPQDVTAGSPSATPQVVAATSKSNHTLNAHVDIENDTRLFLKETGKNSIYIQIIINNRCLQRKKILQ